jgi:hypothetical protein
MRPVGHLQVERAVFTLGRFPRMLNLRFEWDWANAGLLLVKMPDRNPETLVRHWLMHRVHPRYPVNETAQTRSLLVPQEGTNPTQIVDVSESGLRIESNQAFLPGEAIAIRVNQLVIFGGVRHCRELRSGWFSSGVRITEVVAQQARIPASLAEMIKSRTLMGSASSLSVA